MTIIKLKGGLGNQLFQYAFGRFLSIKRDEDLILDKDIMTGKNDIYRQYGLGYFNINARAVDTFKIKEFKYPLGMISKLWRGIKSKIFKIYNIGWNPKILNSKGIYFDGYWQSYKYVDPIRNELLKELTLVNSIDDKFSSVLGDIKNSNSVSLHIRRGDYINDPKTSQIHNICDLDYYDRAVKQIVDRVGNPVFYIFSDDIDWVKENLKIDYPMVFVSDGTMKDYEELVIMSKCKNNIIANSSFSWWGAWLNKNNQKVVVAPSRWNNHHQEEYKYLLPESWIKI